MPGKDNFHTYLGLLSTEPAEKLDDSSLKLIVRAQTERRIIKHKL